jgi:hypothetical protein
MESPTPWCICATHAPHQLDPIERTALAVLPHAVPKVMRQEQVPDILSDHSAALLANSVWPVATSRMADIT